MFNEIKKELNRRKVSKLAGETNKAYCELIMLEKKLNELGGSHRATEIKMLRRAIDIKCSRFDGDKLIGTLDEIDKFAWDGATLFEYNHAKAIIEEYLIKRK